MRRHTEGQSNGGAHVSQNTQWGRPVAVKGTYVSLAPPQQSDYPAIFVWRSEIEALKMSVFGRRGVVTFEEFVPDLERFLRSSGMVMVVLNNRTGMLDGFAIAYNFRPADGWCWVGCYGAPHMRRTPFTFGEASALFFSYLFAQFPLRKLYAEVYEYNLHMQRLLAKLGFREEERLKEHTWFADRYWDSIHYSLSREAWEDELGRLEVLLGVESGMARLLADEGTLQA